MIAYVAVRRTDSNSGEVYDLGTASSIPQVSADLARERDERFPNTFRDMPVLRIARVRITEEPI